MPAPLSPRRPGSWPGFADVGSGPDRYRTRELIIGDDRTRFGVSNDMRSLPIAVEDVDGYEDHAQLDAGEIDIDHVHHVAEVDAKANPSTSDQSNPT